MLLRCLPGTREFTVSGEGFHLIQCHDIGKERLGVVRHNFVCEGKQGLYIIYSFFFCLPESCSL